MEKVNTPKPNKMCWVCKSQNWWWNKLAGSWQCAKCLPNQLDSDYVEPDYPGKGQVSTLGDLASPAPALDPDLEALRVRVAKGNTKLIDAILVIWDITDSEAHIDAFREWGRAADKLNQLCSELRLKGFEDCLYIENGKKTRSCLEGTDTVCLVCPSKRNYAWEELNRLPSPRAPKRDEKTEAELVTFLTKLGEEV